MRHSLLLLGLLVFACKDRPAEQTDDAKPGSGEAPRAWIEAGNGLPSGESSLESLQVKVSGNASATQYEYAFFSFSGDNATCVDAQYGKPKAIGTPLTEITLGDDGKKAICLRGKDKAGNMQADPEKYTWEKVAGAITDEPAPEVRLEIHPTACDTEIDSHVFGNAVTKEYQYAFSPDENPDCDSSDVIYADARSLADKLVISDLGDDGHKTLCLRGLNEDGTQSQQTATRYTWEKKANSLHAGGEIPAAGKAGLGLFCASFVLTSGKQEALGVTLKNTGEGVLSWKASVTEAAPWLTVKVGKDGKDTAINAAGDIPNNNNKLDAGKSESVFFLLTQPKKTDYGKPHQRSLDITFVNEESDYKTTATITLEIPQLDTTTAGVRLTSSKHTHRLYTENLNKSEANKMEIEVVPAFPTSLTKEERQNLYTKFSGQVETTAGIEVTGDNTGDNYVDLKLKAKDMGCGTHEQTLLVYSNGDSMGAADCNIDASKSYVGLSGNARWNTTSCKRIEVTIAMPDNWQGTDLNADDVVNIQDLVLASSQINKTDTTTPEYQKADVDGSGTVDMTDLSLVSSCFGYPE